MTLRRSRRLYLIPVLTKALDILELLETESRLMTLEAAHRQTRIPKTTVYRILKTFTHRGYISQSPDGLYRHVTRSKKPRFGFGGSYLDMPFSVEVTEGLKSAAASVGVDLMILDNRHDGVTAIGNVEEFVKSNVDLVIEFQVEQDVVPVIADKIALAKVPLIAVDTPHPHATYFGVDNYRIGVEAGELLAAHALKNWDGQVELILGLDLPGSSQLLRNRVTGVFEGIRSRISNLPAGHFVRVGGCSMRDQSRKVVSGFLKRHTRKRFILIAAGTDASALGALDAARECQREKHVAIVGQNCSPELVEEMRRASVPLIGSVSHEGRSYGASLVNLGLALLNGQTVPPYNYVAHKIVTPESLSRTLEIPERTRRRRPRKELMLGVSAENSRGTPLESKEESGVVMSPVDSGVSMSGSQVDLMG